MNDFIEELCIGTVIGSFIAGGWAFLELAYAGSVFFAG